MSEAHWQATKVAIQELNDAFAEGEDYATCYRRSLTVTNRFEQLMEDEIDTRLEAVKLCGGCVDG